MKRSTKRPLNLFFIEMIISLLFFSISGAVILSVFAGADKKSRAGETLENVIVFSQSVAEVYSLNGDYDETMKIVTSECGKLDDKIIITKDEEKSENAAGTFSKLTLIFTENGRRIYDFTCAAYVKNGGSDERT